MLNEAKRTSLLRDDGGAGTAWWIFWMIIFLMFGGVASDSSNAWRMRAELQATADAAAHAGVIDLPSGEAAAKSAAITYAHANMSTAVHGDVMNPDDVLVGVWDGVKFTKKSAGANAVMAIARRDEANLNRLKTYFLRLIGLSSWNVNAAAVAQRYFPECLTGNAVIAREIVDFQSNNVFHPGICIHANDHVEVNNGNTWNPGVHVTMPSLADFVIPDSDPDEHNAGIADALGEEWFDPKIVDSIGAFLNAYTDGTNSFGNWPDYIGKNEAGEALTETLPLLDDDGVQIVVDGVPQTVEAPLTGSGLVKTIPAGDWDIENYEQGYIYHITCKQPSNTVTIGASEDHPLQNVAFIANCNVKVGNDGVVKNAVIGSTAGGADKIKPWDNIIHLGQGSIFGVPGTCKDGVKILSTASINGPADTEYHGVQMLATLDIHIAAQAAGISGINIQAGGDVDWASQNAFGPVCKDEFDVWQVPYFRLVL